MGRCHFSKKETTQKLRKNSSDYGNIGRARILIMEARISVDTNFEREERP